MKIKKLNEIIDKNGELIGADVIPKSGTDLETAANKTTDYNVKVAQQPYRYDMMGRFGFTLMPFYESKGDPNQDSPILNDLAKLFHEERMKMLEYYYKHPNKLKPDYRKKSEETFESHSDECKKDDMEFAINIMKTLEPHFEKAYKEPEKKEKVVESVVTEDKMLEKKSEDEMSKKKEPNDIKDKSLVKIAGLINKLPPEDINKITKLL